MGDNVNKVPDMPLSSLVDLLERAIAHGEPLNNRTVMASALREIDRRLVLIEGRLGIVPNEVGEWTPSDGASVFSRTANSGAVAASVVKIPRIGWSWVVWSNHDGKAIARGMVCGAGEAMIKCDEWLERAGWVVRGG
jgi:hypothetical protein